MNTGERVTARREGATPRGRRGQATVPRRGGRRRPRCGRERRPETRRQARTVAEVIGRVGRRRRGHRAPGAPPVRIVFLGGLGEIGRNCACIEVDGRILVLDVGIMFPDPDMPGIDLVLPDFTYLRENAERVDGVILTHGHEDHTGGLAFLLRDFPVPVYGSELTLALARNRVDEAGISRPGPVRRRSPTASAGGSVPATWSSSRSPTRYRTPSPPPSTPPRA